MSSRAEYLIQILEKLGSPLMAAIIGQPAQTKSADDAALVDAQKIASLLAKSVQAGIDMGNAADMGRAGLQDDSLRVALTALAAPLVAEQFRRSGRVPGDADIKRIVTALQAVMSFSENFTPSPENIERLKTLAAEGRAPDGHQVDIQYIHAFVPVINALGAFSFGQAEQKLIVDVASRLTARASEMGNSLLGAVPEPERKLCELVLLRALAPLYAASHQAETARLTALSDEQRMAQASGGSSSLDAVWRGFETRAQMLEMLAKSLLPGSVAAAGKAGDSKAPAAPAVLQSPAPAQPAPVQSTPVQPPPAQSPAHTGNPMAMFAKPKDAAEPPVPPMAPPPVAPPSSPPSSPPGGNPMSFFKKE